MKQTPSGVHPSDEADCGDPEWVVHQESGTCEKSVLVFDAYHSLQQCAPQKEDIWKDAGPSMVHDHPPMVSKTANMKDSKDTSPQAHPNSGFHTIFSSILFNLVFIARYFTVFILSLTIFGNCVNGEQICDKVLTDHVVESMAGRDLNFSHGGYKEIEQGAFANAEAIERLEVSHNCFQNVPEHAFENMTNVYSISMGYNRFTGYPLALQRNDTVKKLMNLKFEGNCIPYIGKDFFQGKEQLSNLNFADNWIESIHSSALDLVASLRIANFSKNKLSALPQVNLTKLKNVRLLDFSDNLLKILQIGYYSRLPGVSSIIITDDSMSVKIGTERVVKFLIAGNSETISYEENQQEIFGSKVIINYTISCVDRNGDHHVLTGLQSPQNGATTVMSVVTGGSAALYPNREKAFIGAIVVLCVILVVFVALFISAVVKIRNAPQPSNSTINDVEKGAENGTQDIPLVKEGNEK